MKKQKYSLPSNIAYSLRGYWNGHKALVLWAAVGVIMRVATPFAGIMLPKLVIDELTARASIPHFCMVVGGMAALMVVLNFFKSYTDSPIDEEFGMIGTTIFPFFAQQKMLMMDYELLEDPETNALKDKAIKACYNNHTPAMTLPRNLGVLLVNILGFMLYGGVISTVNPVILLLLILSALVNWLALFRARKYEENTREERAKISRKIVYLINSLKSPEGAKDIRLYSMLDWLRDLSRTLFSEKAYAEGKVATHNMLAQMTDGVLILVRDGAAYAFLIYLLLQNRITLGDFALMFAAIGTFASWVSGIILQASELMRSHSEMSDIRAYCDVPDRSNTGKGAALPEGGRPLGIRLERVSYTYPGAEHPALRDIDIDIRPGERIAVVGANGAGKTTLVKLICGLYRPTEGRVLLEGVDALHYNSDEYFSLFSAVFQDIHFLSDSIACNISQRPPEETDGERVEKCLRLSGLYEKVNSLPEKAATLLVKAVNNDAVELSGGEKQKLALARAIYKDASVIILDEPTAALDPIAENEVYQKYAELTAGKTSIYISHRLASTRFCDRILFIHDHRIAEHGTHDELMKRSGKYAAMFAIQSSYYAEREETVHYA